ncbi:MAG: TolC family protein [Verrucomicrobia bacterium]|nr:TolC family protein [Verrucomicrobiota bacterium]
MKNIFLTCLLACVSANAVEAISTNSVSRLTLEQAMMLAEQHHPELAEARALAAAAEGRARQAGAFPNPAVIARMESAPISGRTTSEAEYLAGVAQTIPLGSRLSKARQVEQLDRQRLLLDAEARLRAVRRRVHSAFATALYQEQAALAQGKLAASASELVALTKARVQAGDATPDETARVEIELSRARLEHQRASALHLQALVTLAGAIGRPALQIASIAGSLETAFDVPALEELAADLDRHPAIASADAAVAAQSARVDLAKAERVPDINVELLYRRVEADKANTFDVGLRIPLPLFDRNRGKISAARADLTAAEARATITRNDLTQRLRESHTQLANALATARTLRTEILPRAATVSKTAEARHAAGDISLAELLPVRREAAASQLTHLESLRDVMQAWAEVRSLATPPSSAR